MDLLSIIINISTGRNWDYNIYIIRKLFFVIGTNLGLKYEPLGLLPDEPDRRPADILTILSLLLFIDNHHEFSPMDSD